MPNYYQFSRALTYVIQLAVFFLLDTILYVKFVKVILDFPKLEILLTIKYDIFSESFESS